jgi:hypothetical protein
MPVEPIWQKIALSLLDCEKVNTMTAHELYKERRKIIDKEIKILTEKLESMDIEEKKYSLNWGYAGSGGYIMENINELNYQFMAKY